VCLTLLDIPGLVWTRLVCCNTGTCRFTTVLSNWNLTLSAGESAVGGLGVGLNGGLEEASEARLCTNVRLSRVAGVALEDPLDERLPSQSEALE